MSNEKIEIQETISRLEQLQIEVLRDGRSIEKLNQEISSINEVIIDELGRLGKKRKEEGLILDEQALIEELIKVKKTGSKMLSENKGKVEIDYSAELRKVIKKETERGLLFDDGITTELDKNYSELDDEYKQQYFDRISKSVLGNNNDVEKITGIKGAVFEMSRINIVEQQQQEELMAKKESFSVDYNAYPEALESFNVDRDYIESLPNKLADKVKKFYLYNEEKNEWKLKDRVGLNKVKSIFSQPEMADFLLSKINSGDIPMGARKSEVDIDVPVKRVNEDGEETPFIYETKAYPRRIFGQMASNYNQLLKYNEAVAQGIVEGASIEIKGRIDPAFLKWASGVSIEELGAIPNVEIIYNLPLPSGKEYRFVLKRNKKENGLSFSNSDKGFTDEDKKVIAGIQKGIVDKSVLELLSELHPEDFEDDVKQFVKNPSLIEDVETYYKYENQYKSALWKKFLNKSQEGKINTENKRCAMSEYANRDYVEKIVTEYQAYLSQNPEMAKVKKNYIVSENRMSAVINKTMGMLQKIRNFEIDRQSDADEKDKQAKKEGFGYKGSPEGVALDSEHIRIDAIQDINRKEGKAGRSYDELERFQSFSEVTDGLFSKESQRYVEIEIYDPMTNKLLKQRSVSQAGKIGNELIMENLKRLEKKVSELEKSGARDKAIKNNNPRVKKFKSALADLNKSKKDIMKDAQQEARKNKDFSKVKELSEHFMLKGQKIQEELIAVYIEIIGGRKEYDKIAKRVNQIIDQDVLKYIYTVNSDESIIMDEEVIRSVMSGRAAHSELAQGRNVYGAGEIVFSKHNKNFKDYDEWKKWNEFHEFNQPWRLTEINNGSGHYRPSAETLKYVENLVKKESEGRELDISKVRLNDTIMRGLKLKEAGIFI